MTEVRDQRSEVGGQRSEIRGQRSEVRSPNFAERMRVAAKGLGQFRARDLADAMRVRTYGERARVRDYVRDFLRRGEFKRVDRGLYRYVPGARRVTIRQRLWNVVRRMQSPYFSLDDLEQLTSVKRDTIKEFCGWLVREGYSVRVKKGHFRRVRRFEIDVPRIGY